MCDRHANTCRCESGSVNAPNLKQIDVICLDNDGSTRKRFKDFVHLQYFRFKNGSITDMLQKLRNKCNTKYAGFNSPVVMNKLEEVHEEFMTS